jgi:hypothetical protein
VTTPPRQLLHATTVASLVTGVARAPRHRGRRYHPKVSLLPFFLHSLSSSLCRDSRAERLSHPCRQPSAPEGTPHVAECDRLGVEDNPNSWGPSRSLTPSPACQRRACRAPPCPGHMSCAEGPHALSHTRASERDRLWAMPDPAGSPTLVIVWLVSANNRPPCSPAVGACVFCAATPVFVSNYAPVVWVSRDFSVSLRNLGLFVD